MSADLYPLLPILLVDDEEAILHSLRLFLRTDGITNVHVCQDSRQVLPMMEKQPYGIVLLDLMMPGLSGEKLLAEIVETYPECGVIVITGRNDVETAVACMRSSAFDYIVKPIDEERLLASIRKLIEYQEIRFAYRNLSKRLFSTTLQNPDCFAAIITRNRDMHALFSYLEIVSVTSLPVLVSGETGTGKELLARAVHCCSRRQGEYVAISVAGLDDTMFSDTLFGHKRGAFTGAEQERRGLVASAEQGTLFLDEIGDLTPQSQVKLLRLIQERTYYPLGSDLPRHTNARIVVATNRNLETMVESGEFRRDLYFRLNTHHLHSPPLRNRVDDIPLLVQHFLDQAAQEFNRNKPSVPNELYDLLSNFTFPGNIRELRTMVFKSVSASESPVLGLKTFRSYIDQHKQPINPDHNREWSNLARMRFGRLPTIQEATDFLIQEALEQCDGNRTNAAQLLGISRHTLIRHLHRIHGDPS